jgi:uroporphyrinogen III methyltransferase/synthase
LGSKTISGQRNPARRAAGKVYLVGSGPGDPGLLTLKGKAAIERADLVVFDFLANEALLRFAPPGCERILVGKRAGRATLPQDEINRMLIRKARAGRTVVRLKGGDPFIFGRGGEEALALAQAGIPFEVVPGVSSGYAAAAYAGIPVTHRDIASSVAFITGHEDPQKPQPSLEWAKFSASAGTLVLFMGVRNLPRITEDLLRHGHDSCTPAAVIRWGTRAAQQVIEGTLADIARKAQSIEPPAVTLIGDVVRLRSRLAWFERLPLFGRRIVVTRARDQAGSLTGPLEELGAEVIEIPCIELRPPRSWEPLDGAIQRLEKFDYLVVTSMNGVRCFLERLAVNGRDARDLKGLEIGAIGPATEAEFAKAGIKVDFVPDEYRAEGLIKSLAGRDLRGKAFLIPRARIARDVLPRALRERGARVEVVEAYQTAMPNLGARELARWLDPSPDAITFTSSSTVVNFFKLLTPRLKQKLLRRTHLVSIGPVTSNTIRRLGFKVRIEAEESTMPGLVRALCAYFSRAK